MAKISRLTSRFERCSHRRSEVKTRIAVMSDTVELDGGHFGPLSASDPIFTAERG